MEKTVFAFKKRVRPAIGVAVLGLALATAAAAQHTPPSSEIYLAEIVRDADGSVKLGKPVNVTKRKGYDNQPAFSADGKSIYYVAWGKKGPDVWILDAKSHSHRLFRETSDWEFSPTPIPGDEAISVVRMNGMKHELWRYPLDASESPTHLLPDLDQAVFHAWSDETDVLVAERARPPVLRKIKVGAGKGEVVTESVGRTLNRVPGTGDVVFTQKESEDGPSEIKRLHAESGEIETLIEAFPGHDDFAVSADGTLWISDGEAVFIAAPGEKTWKKVADFSGEIEGISRLAVHPEDALLALVGDE